MADLQKEENIAPNISKTEDEDGTLGLLIQEAEKGSPVKQLELGLYYLKLAESDVDKEENGSQALKWLIAASRQGNEEATLKIKHCVDTEIGITDANKSEVKWCLNTSASEKKIRYAAKSLFSQLNPARGTMSREEYMEAINKLTVGHERERKLLLAAGKKIGSTVTENDFVKTLSKKIQGTLTLTADEMDEKSAAYESASPIKKVFAYPKQTAQVVFEQGLEMASKEGMNVIVALIPTNQIYLLAMLFAYSFLTPQFVLLVVPLVVFYISLIIIVISTLQMFYKKRKRKDAVTLAHLLQEQFDTDIDVDSTESQYTWNSLTPYVVYFTSLFTLVLSFSLSNKGYIPCSECFIVSLIMTGFCFVALSDSHDLVTFLALGSHFFASLPIFLSNFPDVPLLKSLVGIITQPFFSLDVFSGLSFNLSAPSVVHMMIPLFLFRMAFSKSWSGFYRVLIPHLVCYFWFSLATTIFPFTTWWGLTRATIGYALLPILVPVSLVGFLLGFIFLLYKLLQTEMIGKVIITALLLGVSVLVSQSKSLFGKKKDKEKTSRSKVKKIITIGFAALAFLPLLFVRMPSLSKKKAVELSWDDYKSLCIPGTEETWAPYQIRCHDFLGTKVNWTGTVQQVKITAIENTAENVINSLPSILSEPLYCIYGQSRWECDEESMSEKQYRHCVLVLSSGRTCHLNNHNKVSLSLAVTIDDSVVTFNTGNTKKDKLLALLPGDVVEVSGTLTSAGTPTPTLKMKALNCLSRELPVMMVVDDFEEEDIMKLFNNALILVLNFAWFPILSYSPAELI